ncbi:hypothetical protein [Halarsenatibacter silvermanii]|uniref:Uncharacterized protein n=1 Tax=Halarsenatibacter silvermanii TaxID=321763 RepID=A0A1G9JSW4_9FIRM|nr:hypothetical protein [Halarsenatibacter silvermanii]SDL40627.1 hypothetical protein SAMN04488692_10482 [Halarsenatibacter silvermanii]
MADKIYYRVQYPLKKGIQKLKKLDKDEEKLDEMIAGLSEYEKSRLRNFLQDWEEGGRNDLVQFIEELEERL